MPASQALILLKWSSSRVLVSAMPRPFANTSAVGSFGRAGGGSTSMATWWSSVRGGERCDVSGDAEYPALPASCADVCNEPLSCLLVHATVFVAWQSVRRGLGCL